MNNTNCVNCGAPIEHGKCRYCGTRNQATISVNGITTKLSSKTMTTILIGAAIVSGYSTYTHLFKHLKTQKNDNTNKPNHL
jgi:hypothetical protein